MITNSLIAGILGVQEIIIILIIVLVLFGGTKIPQLMKGLGKGMNEYKKAREGFYDNEDDTDDKKKDQSGEAESKRK